MRHSLRLPLQLLYDMVQNVMHRDMHPELEPGIHEDKAVDSTCRNHPPQAQVLINSPLRTKSG